MLTHTRERGTLFEFIDEHARTPLELSLLYFWSRHPNAKFTSGAIAGAMGRTRAELEQALEKSAKSGLVERHAGQSVFYCLTANRKKREYVLQLSPYAGTPITPSGAESPMADSSAKQTTDHGASGSSATSMSVARSFERSSYPGQRRRCIDADRSSHCELGDSV